MNLPGVTTALACSRSESFAGGGAAPLPVSPNVRVLPWDLGMQPWGPGRAVVVVPSPKIAQKRNEKLRTFAEAAG